MRGILVLVLVVLVLALIGWISFNHDAQRPGVNLETQKMKDDTKKVIDSSSELLKKAERKIDGSDDAATGPKSSTPATPQPAAAR